MKCEVKHNGDMGMGHSITSWVGIYGLILAHYYVVAM